MLDEKNKRNTRSVPRPLVLDPPPLKLNVPNPEVIELPSPAKTVQAISEESPQKKPPKIMEGLRVLDCLDLDAGNFRSTYLYCKHHNTIIEEETGERNQMIAQEIKAYKKAYVEYQVRRMRRAQCTSAVMQIFNAWLNSRNKSNRQLRCRPSLRLRHLPPNARGILALYRKSTLACGRWKSTSNRRPTTLKKTPTALVSLTLLGPLAISTSLRNPTCAQRRCCSALINYRYDRLIL